jgi:hypothetical protein
VRETERSRVGYEREPRVVGIGAVEQCGNRNVQDAREFDQASRWDAVAAGLVFRAGINFKIN